MNISNNIKVLAVDLGNRRSGLAWFDNQTGITIPLPPLIAEGNKRELGLLREISDRKPSQLLFGIPLSEKGDLTEQSKQVLRFARRIEKRTQDEALLIYLIDEYGSSRDTEGELVKQGISPGQMAAGTVDSLVAANLLREFLDLGFEKAQTLTFYLSHFEEELAKKP